MTSTHGRAWTTKQVAFLREHYRNKGAGWCAVRLGRTVGAVRACALKQGISPCLAQVLSPSSPLIDAQIRRAYTEGRGAATRLAKGIGRPPSWVTRRAGELGLTMAPARSSMYSAEEAAFVEAHAHLTRHRISTLMRQRGWNRTAASIQLFIANNRIGDTGDHLSVDRLAMCLGVTGNSIRAWVKAGELIGEPRSGDDAATAGRVFSLPEIAEFLVRHPHRVDPRKVDMPWLLDIVARYGSLGLIEPKDKGERIVALDALGKSPAEIAVILDTTPNAVSVTLSKHRGRGRKQGDAA